MPMMSQRHFLRIWKVSRVQRKAKGKNEWFIGAITDENKREENVTLDFLEKDKLYVASIYSDADDAHWESNPMVYSIKHYIVDSKTTLKLKLAEGGGAAISLRNASSDDLNKYDKY